MCCCGIESLLQPGSTGLRFDVIFFFVVVSAFVNFLLRDAMHSVAYVTARYVTARCLSVRLLRL